MDREQDLAQRLDDMDAVLRSLVIRVTELELELAVASARPAAPDAAAPSAPPAPASDSQSALRRPEVAGQPVARPAARAVPAAPTAPAGPARVPTDPPARPDPPAPPPRPPRRTAAELARDWDLIGPRGFAVAGGAVLALGIGLFFVLAANRGWIDDRGRVALGGTASALAFGAGLLLRARYGQYWSALAAVAAGIAGAYATLAAAAARYDLVPDALALPLAGLIAAVGAAVGLRWRSQAITAIALLGAALAPALQALDSELSWESAAFAAIVLVATGIVTVPRNWRELLIATSVVVGLQLEWLVGGESAPVSAGAAAVAGVFLATLLGIATGRQLVATRTEIDPLALSYALAAFGITLVFGIQLFEERTDRGLALLVAAVFWGAVFSVLQWRRLPDLALAVGTAALALGAVGTADLLSDSALTIAWAAEAVVLAVLARQLGDARLQSLGLVYGTLATVSALVTEARPDFLFAEGASHLDAVLPLAVAGAALVGSGLLVPPAYRARTESGLLAVVADLREGLEAHRRGLRETLVFAGAALGALSAAFACVSVSWEWGHVAASVVAAVIGAGFLAAAGRLRSDALAAAAYAWIVVVLVEALAFDVETFADDSDLLAGSVGGWSVLAASAGLLLGGYVQRLSSPSTPERDAVLGVAAGVAAAAAALGVGVVFQGSSARGLGLAVGSAVYVALAAGVFRREAFRDVATIMWGLGLVLLVGAELLLVSDPVARGVALAATAFVVGALSLPLAEVRLWLAGAALGLVTTAVVVFGHVRPWRVEDDLEALLAVGAGACALALVGLAAMRFSDARWRDVVTVLWAAGLVALLTAERVVLGGWEQTAVVVALTGGALALLAKPLTEPRLWTAALVVVGTSGVATIASFTPPSHFFTASESPAAGLWILAGCVGALAVVGLTAPVRQHRLVIEAVAGGVALYGLSLGILELAVRVSGASVETDFERGHTAVSALWALVGLGLLVVGLLRSSAALRYGGLALFGLSLAKIFLYDLAELSSVARAFSFIFVGALLLAGGFFLQRLSDRLGPRDASG